MGNRSSRYVKKTEHNSQLETMQKKLDNLQKKCNRFQDDVTKENKQMKTDIKTISEFNEHQEKSTMTADREIEKLKTEIIKLNELDDLKLALKKISNGHNDDRMKISAKIKELITKERDTWDNDVFELKERYETMRKYSMELISMDLSHEREIKDLQRRISYMEEQRRVNLSGKSSISLRQENLFSQKSVLDEEDKGGAYDLKFSKINMAMKRLKDDLKHAELKKTRSH